MSNAIYRLERVSEEPLTSVINHIKDRFGASGGLFDSAELVVENLESLGDAELALLVFEKLYLRNGSYSNLTIELTSYNSVQKAIIIGSGGGEGVLNISWGANSNFAGKAYERLKEIGFLEIQRNPDF